MKKLLLLLFIVPLLAACSKDDNDEVDTNEYIDNSVIMGTWTQNKGYYVTTYYFYKNSAKVYNSDIGSSGHFGELLIKSYKITKDKIFINGFKEGSPYYIVKDTLYLGSSYEPDAFGKYIRVK